VHFGIDQPSEHKHIVFMDGKQQFHFFPSSAKYHSSARKPINSMTLGRI